MRDAPGAIAKLRAADAGQPGANREVALRSLLTKAMPEIIALTESLWQYRREGLGIDWEQVCDDQDAFFEAINRG